MNNTMYSKDVLKMLDLSPEEIQGLLTLAEELKQKKKEGVPHKYLDGKNIALIFEKTSTRTRCAFEVAARDLGMGVTYLDPSGSQIGKKESIADTARVLAGMYDGIEYRGFHQETVETLAKYSSVPVWNGLTDESHPTQVLADLMTVHEKFGHLAGIRFVYLGDGRFNMGNSLMIGCAKMGLQFTICAPEEYFPKPSLVEEARKYAAASGGSVTLETNPDKAVASAQVLYTDVWVSMGEKEEVWEKRIHDLRPYQVNESLMKKADPGAVFMHCLPSFHDLNTEIGRTVGEKYHLSSLEVTDEVFESPASVVFEEAENRMHTIKAVMLASMKQSW